MSNKKNILITGGVGFIGANLAEKLIDQGHNVISIDDYSFGKKENEIIKVKYINDDITNISNIKESIDISMEDGEKGYTTPERQGIRPTLDVNGIWGGYVGEGAKTVLPSKAFAKISMRLVPDQNSLEISKLFRKHFESIAPKSVKVKVHTHHGGEPVVTNLNSKGYKAASLAMKKTFGKKPIPVRQGGSIPIVSLFEKELNTNCILIGFGLASDAIHSPNEHYGLFNFYKGIETIPYFFKYFNEL